MATIPTLPLLRVLAACAVAFALVSCGRGDGGGDNVLHRGNGAEPLTLDPHLTSGTWENDIVGDMFIGLYTEDAAGEPIPGMALRHEVSEDGLAWTFTLREAQWSDGEPVTAHDFVYALRRILTPATLSQYASLLYGMKNAEAVNTGRMQPEELGVHALDDRTLVIELEYPAPYLPSMLTHTTGFPVPAHVVEQHGSRWIQPQNMAVNGPYMLRQWRSNDFVHLVKNENFYEADQVCFSEVYFYPTNDVNAAVRRVRAGELDLNGGPTGFPGQQREELERQLPGYIRVSPYLGTTYYVFNTARAPFDDVRVRQALSMSLDREFIIREIKRSNEIPSSRLIPPGIANYPGGPQADWWEMEREERLAEARRMLEEAGFGPSNPLRFEFTYRNSGDNPRIAPVVQAGWQEIAPWVQVSIFGGEVQIHYDNLRTGNFEVGDAGWIADYNDAQNFLFLLESRSGPMNYGNYSNPEFDSLVDRSNRELDQEVRARLMVEAENLLVRDMPIMPMWYNETTALVSPQITGWVDNVNDIHRTRYLCREGLDGE